jgi:hypothetical protein
LIQNRHYFFYGSPANYALVSQEDQNIWLVTYNLSAAQFISQAFKSKITLVIFDLTTFENYTTSLIDNSVCFNWQVPNNVLKNTSVLDTSDSKINSTVYTGVNLQLTNIVKNDTLLLLTRCQELQQQLMCIHHICRSFNTTNIALADRVKEIVATNLNLSQIETELYNLANETILEYPKESFDMLNILDRLYE